MTPAPEEAKGQMWIASETMIKVKSIGIQLIATQHIMGQIQDDTFITYLDKVTGQKKTTSVMGCILVMPQALTNKGYSETIIDDKQIQIGIEGTDIITWKNVAGYYLVHKDDLKVLIGKYKTP